MDERKAAFDSMERERERYERLKREGLGNLAQGGAGCAVDDQASPATTAYGAVGASRAEITLDNVDEVFAYQPWSQHQVECGNAVREALVGAVKAILRFVPPSPDRSVAIRKLREARMDANSAITHYGRF